MGQDELLINHRDFYGQYHQHKEQMAYAASALYLAGVAALLYADPNSLSNLKALKVLFSVLIFIAAFVFVGWQLLQRQLAADVVEACERLLARGTGEGSGSALADPRVYKGLHMPHFLVDELVVVAESRKMLGGARVSTLVTYITMFFAAVLIVARVFFGQVA